MVKINLLRDEPYILAALGVKISQAPFEKTLEELYNECKENKEESKKMVNFIIKNHNHNILLDFSPFAITIEELSRFAAIYLWRNINSINLIAGAGIEASFRVTKPINYNSIVKEFGRPALNLYECCLEENVPVQDAKYILPEGVLTRIIFTISPRYFLKLRNVLKNSPLEELREIGQGFGKIVGELGFETEIEEKPPTSWEIWEKKSNFKNSNNSLVYPGKSSALSLNYNVKGSLSMYADLVRERQILCEFEPLERVARNARFVIPNSFSGKIKEEYLDFARNMNEKQIEFIEKGDPNFVYFLLLGQEARSNVTGAGTGIIETSKKRCCGVVLGELRNNFAVPITRELSKYEELKNIIGPRCWRENRCMEPLTFKTKKNKCPVFEKYFGKRPDNFEELLDLLNEPVPAVSLRE